jgi:MltA-interacting protein MipA
MFLQLQRVDWRRFGLVIIYALLVLSPHWARASTEAASQQVSESPSSLAYTVGAKFKFSERLDNTNQLRLVPVVGLRYGRWKIGANTDVDEWLAFSAVRKEPTVSYDFFSGERFKTILSLRIQNLSTGEAFDFSEPGRKTLRGRLLFNYQVFDHTALGLELTRDLLNRGDGTTFTTGVSRSFALTDRSTLGLNAGVTWASATHWQTINQKYGSAANLGSGFGSTSLGASYRYAPSKTWAWYGTVNANRSVGDLISIQGTRWFTSAQVGVLYFGQWQR